MKDLELNIDGDDFGRIIVFFGQQSNVKYKF